MFLYRSTTIFLDSTSTSSGLKYQYTVENCSTTLGDSTCAGLTGLRNAVFSQRNKILSTIALNRIKANRLLALQKNSEDGLKLSASFFTKQLMQVTQANNRGWIWSKVAGVSSFGDATTLQLARRGWYSLLADGKGNDTLRTYIRGGLTNKYSATTVQARVPAYKNPFIIKTSRYYHTTFYKLLRLRFERWFFKCLGGRTYIWFSNIWKDVTARVNSKVLVDMYSTCMRKLAVKGSRFYMEPEQAHIVFQSIFLAVTSVTGLQFFMKMMSIMISKFRSHWQLIRHLMGLFYSCKNYFWFKSLYNYRLIMRGKFGGQLRARQQVFQHGVVKIHQWDQNVNYARIFPVTIYGVFSVRFWLQMRDMRILRLVDATDGILRYHRRARKFKKRLNSRTK